MLKKIFIILLSALSISASVDANTDKLEPKRMNWSFDGAFGKFDYTSIQRGFQVYKEVCSACHAIEHIAFRNLQSIGFSEAEVKSLASSYTVKDGPNDEGEMYERPGRPSDYFPRPFENEKAARAANNGAYPPDLSLITKARHDGANYVYSLLTGYETPPEGFIVGENMHYNPYYIGGGRQLAMPQPLHDGQVTYQDKEIQVTIDQMAKDVVNFLQWAAEPEMEVRHRIGFQAIIFFSIFSLLFLVLKHIIWSDVYRKNNKNKKDN